MHFKRKRLYLFQIPMVESGTFLFLFWKNIEQEKLLLRFSTFTISIVLKNWPKKLNPETICIKRTKKFLQNWLWPNVLIMINVIISLENWNFSTTNFFWRQLVAAGKRVHCTMGLISWWNLKSPCYFYFSWFVV